MSGFDRDKHLKPMFSGYRYAHPRGHLDLLAAISKHSTNLARKTTAANRELAELQGLLQEYRVLENKLKKWLR